MHRQCFALPTKENKEKRVAVKGTRVDVALMSTASA